MKVERKKEEKFEPITITIETEEEAKKMWLILNTRTSYVVSMAEKYNVELEDHSAFEMWDEFDNSFDPTK